MRNLLGVFLLMVLVGCAHTITFTNFDSGQVIQGQYNELDRSVTVTMPDGEVLSGKYSALSNATVTFGNAFAFSGASTASAFGTGITAGGQSNAYALLTSKTSKLVMEVIVSYSEWNGHGFGEARIRGWTGHRKLYNQAALACKAHGAGQHRICRTYVNKLTNITKIKLFKK